MPELPDISAYLTALAPRVVDKKLLQIRIATPFLLRTIAPAPAAASNQTVTGLTRSGKRVAIGLENDIWLVIHLMIAGRLHWRPAGIKLSGRQNLAAFDFEGGTLTLTEAGAKRRASLHIVEGEEALKALDPGGLDIFTATPETFRAALSVQNHTLKRALTDPRYLSGIGNAYSDEILHAAQLSPIAQTAKLTDTQWATLFRATRETLQIWIDRLNAEAQTKFPEHVTAFRPDMAVHGRYGEACPRCHEKIQRIRFADNETNYCARCQTGGKLLADRGLSRLLGSDWPRTLEEMEELLMPAKSAPPRP